MKTTTTSSHSLELARLRSWVTLGLFAAGTLYWFADLARWLAPV